MPVTGPDLIRVAAVLSSHMQNDEAGDRAQIGRIYYAAFLECRRYCESSHNYVRKTGGSSDHKDIPNLLSSKKAIPLGGQMASVAYHLRLLRVLRNAADYDEFETRAKIAKMLADAQVHGKLLSTNLIVLGEPGL